MLQVSANRRFLIHDDGTPFFYLGDTAWELFHRLTLDEADYYLRDRAAKGFTVIQAVVLAEMDGLHTPNMNGDCRCLTAIRRGRTKPISPTSTPSSTWRQRSDCTSVCFRPGVTNGTGNGASAPRFSHPRMPASSEPTSAGAMPSSRSSGSWVAIARSRATSIDRSCALWPKACAKAMADVT